MASPWQRHLLVMAEEAVMKDTMMLTPGTVAVAVVVLVVLMVLVLMCVCGNDGSSKEPKTEGRDIARKNAVNTKTSATADSTAVDMPVEGEAIQNDLAAGEAAPVSNGVTQGAKNGMPSSNHSRQPSSGSSQMRPTSLRELPDLPGTHHKRNHSGAGIVDKPPTTHSNAEEMKNNDPYDHLRAKIATNSTAAVNYDHINPESPREPSMGTTPASEPDTASEGHYAQVRERTYDVVKDVRARANSKAISSADYDLYAKVKDVDDDKEDPYAKVKDAEKDTGDDGYAHLQHNHVITSPDIRTRNTATDDEDPYERMCGDSASGRVLPAAKLVTADDPYSVVTDQSVTVVPLSGGGASPPKALSSYSSSASKVDDLELRYADEEVDAQDEYARVVKDRNSFVHRENGSNQSDSKDDDEIQPYYTSPPEPPRTYGANEVWPGQGTADHADINMMDIESSGQQVSKEHRYTKVTARESLASMTARKALNTYETVADLPENTYATVEGGSGDGVVQYATPGTPNLQHSTSQLSETYAEIGASGGYATPAPEPPSLDTLHSMTKSTTSNDGELASRVPSSPAGGISNVLIADDGYAIVSKASGFSPSETALPQIPRTGTSGSIGSLGSFTEDVTVNGVILHSDYHSVKDCILDQDNEDDPNYESVDEALSKAPVPPSNSLPLAAVSAPPGATVVTISHVSPSRRSHQYEEVSPVNSPLPSPTVQTPSRVFVRVAATASPDSAPPNSASSSGPVPKQLNSNSAEAAQERTNHSSY